MIIPLVLIVGLVFGFFFGLQWILNTPTPIRVVESGSMCIPSGKDCAGWLSIAHPFAPTLHKGDIIIVQGVDAKDLNTNYPNSDIIVYKKPSNVTDTPIVHRIVTSYEKEGILYFETKGDGNDNKWPQMPSESEYDSHHFWNTGDGVPADLVEGKVILRIPYFGWMTLLLNGGEYPWVLPLIISLILLLVVAEFVFLLVKRKKILNPKSAEKMVEIKKG